MKSKTDNLFLFIGVIPSCVILTIFFLLMAISAAHGPVYLDEKQVNHYVEAAEHLWNGENNLINDFTLNYIVKEDRIIVSSNNLFEQTVTVLFTETDNKVIVNDPNVHFTNCTIFFTILILISLFGTIVLTIQVVKDFRKSIITDSNEIEDILEKEQAENSRE